MSQEQAHIEQLSIAAKGVTRFGLSTFDIANLQLPVPQMEKQKDIVCFLDSETNRIDQLVEKKVAFIQRLNERTRCAIQRVLTKGTEDRTSMHQSSLGWMGSIPRHWGVLKVKHLFRLECQAAPPNHNFELLSVYTDIGVRPRKELEERGNKASTTEGYWLVKQGDIVVNKLLAWMGAVGYSAYEGVTSPAYDILRPRPEVHSKYYHYLFRSPIIRAEFRRWSRGIMDMRLRLYFEHLGNIRVPVPPFHEQQEIVKQVEVLEADSARLAAITSDHISRLKEFRFALITAVIGGQVDVKTWRKRGDIQRELDRLEATV